VEESGGRVEDQYFPVRIADSNAVTRRPEDITQSSEDGPRCIVVFEMNGRAHENDSFSIHHFYFVSGHRLTHTPWRLAGDFARLEGLWQTGNITTPEGRGLVC
jgi:hypothetical protein